MLHLENCRHLEDRSIMIDGRGLECSSSCAEGRRSGGCKQLKSRGVMVAELHAPFSTLGFASSNKAGIVRRREDEERYTEGDIKGLYRYYKIF